MTKLTNLASLLTHSELMEALYFDFNSSVVNKT